MSGVNLEARLQSAVEQAEVLPVEQEDPHHRAKSIELLSKFETLIREGQERVAAARTPQQVHERRLSQPLGALPVRPDEQPVFYTQVMATRRLAPQVDKPESPDLTRHRGPRGG